MKKMNRSRNFVLLLAIFFFGSLIVPEEGYSRRGGFGGGMRSMGRSASWGKSRSTARSGWDSSKGKRMGSQRGQTSAKSKADRALYQKAKSKGTAFKSRADAKQSFEKQYGQQYSSKFDKKPAVRPNHIPQNTKVDGKTTPVNYNPQFGGYGYYGPGGRWMMYSAMADVAMLGMLMNRHSYYYGEPPGAYGGRSRGNWGGLMVFMVIIFLAVIMRPRL